MIADLELPRVVRLMAKVYAGTDPITDKRHDLTDTIPPGPTAKKDAEQALTRLLGKPTP
jgi:hypothetical protein